MSHQYGLYAASALAATAAVAVYNAAPTTKKEAKETDKLIAQKLEKILAHKLEKRIVPNIEKQIEQKLEKRITQKLEKLAGLMQANQNTLSSKINKSSREIKSLASACDVWREKQRVNDDDVDDNLISLNERMHAVERGTYSLAQDICTVRDTFMQHHDEDTGNGDESGYDEPVSPNHHEPSDTEAHQKDAGDLEA